MSDEELTPLVPQLLGLPVLGSHGFRCHEPRPFDPFDDLRDLKSVQRTEDDDPRWSAEIATLIGLAGGAAFQARKNALVRLRWLFANGLLSEAESASFGNALWTYRTGAGFPEETRFSLVAFLVLPAPKPRHEVEAAFIELVVMSPTPIPWDHAWAVAQVSYAGLQLEGTPAVPPVQWTKDQALRLFERVRRAWPAARDALRIGGLALSEGRRTANVLREVLRLAVIPNVEAGDMAEIDDLIADMARHQVAIEIILPSILKPIPERTGHASEMIQRAMVSNDVERATQATMAVDYWRLLAARDLAPAVPPILFHEIASIIAMRRVQALLGALDVAASMFTDRLVASDPEVLSAVTGGLAELLNETDYSANEQRARLPRPMVPALRRGCVAVARALRETDAGDVPPVSVWLTRARMDPLPEVRRAANENTEEDGPATQGGLTSPPEG